MGWTPPGLFRGIMAACGSQTTKPQGAVMEATTIAVDLAKEVFEVVSAAGEGRGRERRRLSRRQFEQSLGGLRPGTEVVMEACGTAHYWGRECQRRGLVPHLLPPQYVRAYVRRNKTDRADAEGSWKPVAVRPSSPCRSNRPTSKRCRPCIRPGRQWQRARTAQINVLRGLLREFGLPLPARRHPGVPSRARAPRRGVPRVAGQLFAWLSARCSRKCATWTGASNAGRSLVAAHGRTRLPTGSGCKRSPASARS